MRTTTYLTWAGALPFVACAVALLLGVSSLPLVGSVSNVASAYGLAIVAFVAGSHWGICLRSSAALPVNLLITSNVVTVAAWLAYLLPNTDVVLVVLMISFAYLLIIDLRLHSAGIISSPYFELRRAVTALVLLALLVMLLAS